MVRRNDTAVKIGAEVVAEAKIVAACREMSLAEYLTEILRPVVSRDLRAELSRRLEGGPSPKPRKPKGGD